MNIVLYSYVLKTRIGMACGLCDEIRCLGNLGPSNWCLKVQKSFAAVIMREQVPVSICCLVDAMPTIKSFKGHGGTDFQVVYEFLEQ